MRTVVSVRIYPVQFLNQLTFGFTFLHNHSSPWLKVKVTDPGQGLPKIVTRSVWPRYSIEGSLFSSYVANPSNESEQLYRSERLLRPIHSATMSRGERGEAEEKSKYHNQSLNNRTGQASLSDSLSHRHIQMTSAIQADGRAEIRRAGACAGGPGWPHTNTSTQNH